MTTAASLRREVDEGWRAFRDAIRGLGRAGLDEPTSEGWTFHDLVAHVCVWEALAARRLRTYRETGALTDIGGEVDAINAEAVASHRLVGPEALLDELDASHRRLVEEVARLDDALVAAHDEWAAQVVAGNSFAHYRDHAAELAP